MKNLILLFLVAILAAVGCTSAPSTAKNMGGFVDLDLATFKTKMSEPNTIILDVRTPGEIAEGKIPGAFDLDIQNPEFKSQIGELDKAKTYLIYCRSGGRSSRACSIMKEAGFEKLYNLEGGFNGWKAAK